MAHRLLKPPEESPIADSFVDPCGAAGARLGCKGVVLGCKGVALVLGCSAWVPPTEVTLGLGCKGVVLGCKGVVLVLG